MMKVIIVFGFLLLVAGVLALMLSEKSWRGLMPRGSRWANQASTTGLLIFSGLGWIGVTLMLLYGHAVWLGWRSAQWVEVTGVVEESRLVETRSVRTTNLSYRPEVIYEYTMNGEMQRGTRVDFAGSATVDRDFVEGELRTRYAPGAAVAVFVDPSDATQSVLMPGVPDKAAIFVGLGAALLAVAIWQLRALLRDWEGDGKSKAKSSRKRKRHAR